MCYLAVCYIHIYIYIYIYIYHFGDLRLGRADWIITASIQSVYDNGCKCPIAYGYNHIICYI